MEEKEPQYELTPKGQEMAEQLAAKKTATVLPKLENKTTVGEQNVTSVILLGQIYDLMVQMREDEIAHREKIKNQQKAEAEEENNKQKELLEAIGGKKPFKKKAKAKPKARKKPKAKKGAPDLEGIISGVIGAGVVGAAVSEKTKEEEKAKAVTPTAPTVPPPPPTPPAPKVEEVKPPAAPPEKKPPTAVEVEKPVAVAGAPGMIATDLAAKGVSQKGQANVLAQVKAESNFVPKNENLNYKSAERIQQVFGKNRIPSLQFAQSLVNNPEGLANVVYAKTDGNSQEGDGWKYRGRGFLQHTGKNQYKAIKDYTGVDVVSNPDLLNKPEVASQAVPWFFLNYKRKKPEQLDNISEVNKAVGFAGGAKESEHRMELAAQFEKSMPSSGTKLASATETNKDMKDQIKQDKTAQVANVTKELNVAQTQTPEQQSKGPVDDRPAYLKKAVA